MVSYAMGSAGRCWCGRYPSNVVAWTWMPSLAVVDSDTHFRLLPVHARFLGRQTTTAKLSHLYPRTLPVAKRCFESDV